MTYDTMGPPLLFPEYMPNRNRLADSVERCGGGVPASLIFYVHNNIRLPQGGGNRGALLIERSYVWKSDSACEWGGGVSVGPAVCYGPGAISMKED